MENKIFCYAPWSNLEINPSGEILPCCKFQNIDNKFRIDQHSISDYRNSTLLKKTKQSFIDGQWPNGCERCQLEEYNNIKSKRQLDYERWKENYDTYNLDSNQLLTVSMAFGNICNLKCITCNPGASSLWKKEYKDIYNIEIQSIESHRKDLINNITNIAPALIHMDIHGGEPFLSGIEEHKNLLDHYIQTNVSKNISIHYTTNGTIWPQQWIEYWRHFREIDLQISIDGIHNRYEYIRFPGKWNTLVENIEKYQQYQKENSNFRISISHTVSAYNIYYLDEFFTWCYNNKLPRPWLGRVHHPAHMRPSVWPWEIKNKIITHLENSKWEDVQTWAGLLSNTNDQDQFEIFKTKIHEHDTYRKISFINAFPELADYI